MTTEPESPEATRPVPEPTETLGSLLRRARQDKRVALEVAAKDTRIHATTLKALEEDARGELPAEVFTRGFIKIYAQYLGLNPDEMLGLYLQHRGEKTAIPDEKVNAQEVLAGETMAEPPTFHAERHLFTAAVVILVSLILYLGYKITAPPPEETPEPAHIAEPRLPALPETLPPTEETALAAQDVAPAATIPTAPPAPVATAVQAPAVQALPAAPATPPAPAVPTKTAKIEPSALPKPVIPAAPPAAKTPPVAPLAPPAAAPRQTLASQATQAPATLPPQTQSAPAKTALQTKPALPAAAPAPITAAPTKVAASAPPGSPAPAASPNLQAKIPTPAKAPVPPPAPAPAATATPVKTAPAAPPAALAPAPTTATVKAPLKELAPAGPLKKEKTAVPAPAAGAEKPAKEPSKAEKLIAAIKPMQPPYALEATFREDTWVRIQVDGAKPKPQYFRAGEKSAWQANNKIQLFIGNAGGVDLTLNNTKLPPLGKPGNTTRITIQPQLDQR